MKCTHTDGQYHDCEYVDTRNKLIPLAERRANKMIGQVDYDDECGDLTQSKEEQLVDWGSAFLVEMDELWHSERERVSRETPYLSLARDT